MRTDGGIIDWGATGDNSQPKGVPDHGNVDFRQWGSGFWFQNVRMAYCKIVILSSICLLSVSLTRKVSLFQ